MGHDAVGLGLGGEVVAHLGRVDLAHERLAGGVDGREDRRVGLGRLAALGHHGLVGTSHGDMMTDPAGSVRFGRRARAAALAHADRSSVAACCSGKMEA